MELIFNFEDEDSAPYWFLDLQKSIKKINWSSHDFSPGSLKDLKRVDIIFCSTLTSRALNFNYRGKNEVTDVLTFLYSDEGSAEIYISTDIAQKQADEFGNLVEEELVLLIIHGMIHAAGIDHEKDKEQLLLTRKLEEALIQQSGQKIEMGLSQR